MPPHYRKSATLTLEKFHFKKFRIKYLNPSFSWRADCIRRCGGTRKSGREWETFRDHCYLWDRTPINWYSARHACEREGFHLASITSDSINQYVVEGMARRMDNVWIGGTDKEKEGTWKWTDGSPFEFTRWRPPKQPDNYKGREDCLHITMEPTSIFEDWSEPLWNDWPCTNEGEGYVCAKRKCQ